MILILVFLSSSEFVCLAEQIATNLATNVLPYSEQSLTKYNDDIEKKLDTMLDAVNFKQKFGVLNVPPKPTGVDELYTQMGNIDEKKLILAKICQIKSMPNLLDSNILNELEQFNIDDVSI